MKSRIIELLIVSIAVCAIVSSGVNGKTENSINKNSIEFRNNYIDMREVTDFQISEDGNGITLYTENGEGYYWER